MKEKDDLPVYNFQLPEPPSSLRLPRPFSFPTPDLTEKTKIPLVSEESYLSPERVSLLLAPLGYRLKPQSFLSEEVLSLCAVKPTPAIQGFPMNPQHTQCTSSIPSSLLDSSNPALVNQLLKEMLTLPPPLITDEPKPPLSSLAVFDPSSIPKEPVFELLNPGFPWHMAQTPLPGFPNGAKMQKFTMLKPDFDVPKAGFSSSISSPLRPSPHQGIPPTLLLETNASPIDTVDPLLQNANTPQLHSSPISKSPALGALNSSLSPNMPLLSPIPMYPSPETFPFMLQSVPPSPFLEVNTPAGSTVRSSGASSRRKRVRKKTEKREHVEPVGPEMRPGSPFLGYKDEKRARFDSNNQTSGVWKSFSSKR